MDRHGQLTTLQTLGVVAIRWLALSADGLRMTLVAVPINNGAQLHLYFTDRATLAGTFRTVDTMPGAPDVGTDLTSLAVLADDCTKLYMSGLGSIFYAEEIVPQ